MWGTPARRTAVDDLGCALDVRLRIGGPRADDVDLGGQVDDGILTAEGHGDRPPGRPRLRGPPAPASPAGRRCSTRDLVAPGSEPQGRDPAEHAAGTGDEDLHRANLMSGRAGAIRPAPGSPAARPPRRSISEACLMSTGRRPGHQHGTDVDVRGGAHRRTQRRVGESDATTDILPAARPRRPRPGCRKVPLRPRRPSGRSRATRRAARSATGVSTPEGLVIRCTSRPSTHRRPSASRWPTSPVRCQPGLAGTLPLCRPQGVVAILDVLRHARRSHRCGGVPRRALRLRSRRTTARSGPPRHRSAGGRRTPRRRTRPEDLGERDIGDRKRLGHSVGGVGLSGRQ